MAFHDSMLVMFHIEFDGDLEERLNLFSREESPLTFIQKIGVREDEGMPPANYLFHFKNAGDLPMEIVYGDGHTMRQIDDDIAIQGRETYEQKCELTLEYMGPRFPELTDYVSQLLEYMKQQNISFAIFPTDMSGAHVLAVGYNAKNGYAEKSFREALQPIFSD